MPSAYSARLLAPSRFRRIASYALHPQSPHTVCPWWKCKASFVSRSLFSFSRVSLTKGNFCKRGDDDRRAVGQGLHQLPGVLVNLLHHALFVLELIDRVLKLLIEYAPVGHHHHRIEHLLIRFVVQAGETMRQPGNRIGFAGTGGMLHQIISPGPCSLEWPTGGVPHPVDGNAGRSSFPW